ncbi:TonB-dependent receptor [soil metagenome]
MNKIQSKILTSVFLTFAVLVLGVVGAQAQTASATLNGTVSDENGAVVAGVNVVVVNNATGLQRAATTNSDGYFVVPLLTKGEYTVTLERDGFAPTEIKNVVLNIGSQININAKLKVKGVSGVTVDVTAETSLIDESAAVGTTVDRQFVENLPLNGRSLQSLINLSPGVVLTVTDGTSLGQFSVNGQRANSNYFSIDGVGAPLAINNGANLSQAGGGTIPAFSTTGTTQSLISVDAIEEFKIQTSTFAPEFGRTPGAQISIVSRGGANKFNGSLFEYFRNEKLDANDWFANRVPLTAAQIAQGLTKQPRPPLRQNDFGGTFGGRIIKDKFFFFGTYEGLRLVLPRVSTIIVPNEAVRAMATGNIRQILDSLPLPNGPAVDAQRSRFTGNSPSISDQNTYSARFDYAISPVLTTFVRYSNSRSNTIAGNYRVSIDKGNTEALTGNLTWIVNSKTTNDFRFNYSQNEGGGRFELRAFGGSTPAPDSAIFPSYANQNNGLLSLSVIGISTFTVGTNADSRQRQINLVDNFSYIAGSHSLKFGIDYRFLFPNFNPLNYFFGANFTGLTNAAGVAVPGTLLSGVASTLLIQHRTDKRTLYIHNFSAFAQDTWRVNNRLTLTYGVRWEVNPAPTAANGNNPIVLTNLNSGNLSTVGLAPDGTKLFKTTYGNFAPRIGAAYRLFDTPGRETVIRGGFGVFYDIPTGSTTRVFENIAPYTAQAIYSNVPFPANTTIAPLPVVPAVAPYGSTFAPDPELKLPYTLQWNLAVEQSLGKSQTFTATYVGTVGRRLIFSESPIQGVNFTNPLFRDRISIIRNLATSDYHAMQLQYQRRLSRGFQALASYTWAHSIDIASRDNISTPPIGIIPASRYRGNSDFDIRHTFSGALTYDVPSPSQNKFVRAVFGGWSTDMIFYARSAPPVDIVTARNVPGIGLNLFRPDLVAGVPLYINDNNEPGGRIINRAAFVIPTEPRDGNLGRNVLRGYNAFQVDFGLRREFKLGERVRLQLKGEMFNIFNRPNFGSPQNNLDSGTAFGKSSNLLGRSLGVFGGLSSLYQIGGPRSTQLSLKILF